MRKLPFTKMHGIGNDYIYLDATGDLVIPENLSALAKDMSDRHFGVGGDGLVLICPSQKADFRMEMYNADGSRGRMCGNASRCIGKYVYERGLTHKQVINLETDSGVVMLHLELDGEQVISVTVNMGKPEFSPGRIPVRSDRDRIVDMPVSIAGRNWLMTAVSMGNPHAVVFIDESPDQLDLARIGPEFEHHPMFPEKVNTEFVQVLDRTHLRMRVWERGSGETLACGTGACAALAAAVVSGRSERKAILHLKGGDLTIDWQEASGDLYKTGPAAFVFDGVYEY